MEQAFKDLRGLMGKAQDMVTLAERFRERSSAGGSGVDRAASGDEAMDADMENELISLGIASPVTKTTAGALYHQQLSRQVRGGGCTCHASCNCCALRGPSQDGSCLTRIDTPPQHAGVMACSSLPGQHMRLT